MKTALITGITGQDGAYLSQLLLNKNYKVVGLTRSNNPDNLRSLRYLGILDNITLEDCDLTDIKQIQGIMNIHAPDEIYNLAAQSSVSLSFNQPIGTIQFNIISVLNLLESLKTVEPGKKTKFYQASSSEMFGLVEQLPITENTVFHPLSPYAISKATAHWLTVNYRESYGLFACCGVLFNHESYLRSENFFMKKVMRESLRIKFGLQEQLEVGNIDIRRDFGDAKRYVEVMWLMLQQDLPEDYLVCSGKSLSLRSIIEHIFMRLELPLEKLNINQDLYRPTDIQDIYGDNKKAKMKLQWQYDLDFFDVIDHMLEEEEKICSTIMPDKIKVVFFQRRPLPFHKSVEYIFNDVRRRLPAEIESITKVFSVYSKGILQRMRIMWEAYANQGDVNHITGDIHFSAIWLKRRKTMLTVLDCGMLSGSKGIRHFLLKYFWFTLPLRKSALVTVISGATKKELLKYANYPADDIHIVYVAVSPAYVHVPKVFNKAKPVILQVGTKPNKNLDRLIAAVKDIDCHLSIIGRLPRETEELLDKHKISYTNAFDVSEAEIIDQYVNCDILSFVSTYEGFGMPIVEANAVGRPVITSNLLSMPEVAGQAACLVDPFNTEDIRNGILKIIQDDQYRNQLVQKGLENRKRFDPDHIAMQYASLYKKLNQ